MVAVPPAPSMIPPPCGNEPEIATAGSAARVLARCYLRYVSAVWRGDQSAATFAAWIDQYWTVALPPVPAAIPDAISPHGGGGAGITWFEVEGEIRGYIGRGAGGYRVPARAIREAAALAPHDPKPGKD